MDFEKYYHKAPYPRPENFTTYYVYNKGEVLATLTSEEASGYSDLSKAFSEAIIQKVVDKDAWGKAKKEYDEAVKAKENQFWEDAAEALGIHPSHPKLPILRSLAYEYGHSYGSYYEHMFDYFEEFAQLLTY